MHETHPGLRFLPRQSVQSMKHSFLSDVDGTELRVCVHQRDTKPRGRIQKPIIHYVGRFAGFEPSWFNIYRRLGKNWFCRNLLGSIYATLYRHAYYICTLHVKTTRKNSKFAENFESAHIACLKTYLNKFNIEH